MWSLLSKNTESLFKPYSIFNICSRAHVQLIDKRKKKGISGNTQKLDNTIDTTLMSMPRYDATAMHL